MDKFLYKKKHIQKKTIDLVNILFQNKSDEIIMFVCLVGWLVLWQHNTYRIIQCQRFFLLCFFKRSVWFQVKNDNNMCVFVCLFSWLVSR